MTDIISRLFDVECADSEQAAIVGEAIEEIKALRAELWAANKEISQLSTNCKNCSYLEKTKREDSQRLADWLRHLKKEINCRREHGAEGASHLEYIEKALGEILGTVEG